MRHTDILAEPGSTAEGQLDTMFAQIELAREIGCDIWKNQWTSDPEAMCVRRHAPEYLGAYRNLAWPVGWHEILARRCETAGLRYVCATYVPADVAVVAPYVWAFKVSSFDALDTDFLDAHRPYQKPVFISTGMMNHEDVVTLGRMGALYDWRLLHCVSAYPCPINQINLAALGLHYGLSDHTTHPMTGALAVALGAQAIEFHFRLEDCDPTNADYAVARSPEAAREYVANVRLAEAMLGSGVKRIMPAEAPMLRYAVRPE